MPTLVLSPNRRFLQYTDGRPFFYLADTAWELLHRLTLDEADYFLQERARKGYSVIQTVILAEMGGLKVPNRNGDLPLHDLDPEKPNEPYFTHVDEVLATAERHGLFLALLPSWGDKWNKGTWGDGPEIFTPENAYTWGKFLASRYVGRQVMWALGGDRHIESQRHREIINEMARGLRDIHQGAQLMSFHPQGGAHSSDPFHKADWLDFNMIQSGHGRNAGNYDMIAKDYGLYPTKPCMDAEPGYEDHPAGFDITNGYLDDYDCRKAAYWSVFSGAHGHTYGCHAVWQMASSAFEPVNGPRRDWREALHLPGAGQMGFVRQLMLSRPLFDRIPDQALLLSDPKKGPHHQVSTRSSDGSYAMVYLPARAEIELNGSLLNGDAINVWWFNPRQGHAQLEGARPRTPHMTFQSPALGLDWVLVLDDASRGFGPPGTG